MSGEGQKRVLLGRIAGAHGIRGDVLITTFTATPEAIGAYGALTDGSGTRSFQIATVRATARGAVVRVKGIADRNAAEALKGIELYVARDKLPPAAEGEFYHADLIGLPAVDPDGRPIGKVVAIHNFGAGDLIELQPSGSASTELLPFTETVVPEVDIAAGRVVIALPPSTEAREED